MEHADRGLKHLCPDCGIKYYDLKRKVVACPKCGALPPPPKLKSGPLSAKRTGKATFGRFP